ncbi:MAG: tRNA threonylcarbamoyladenosine dehydratase [Oscillospiraceae bacterium]|nr:tRNA threonylcarbamoyladenosine dehydratase [Oscillospiraceae bacterium]
MKEIFSRSAALYGEEAIESLKHRHVAVFGLGGVGGYVCEMLARSGVGELTIIDSDSVSLSNRNRQIIATESTTGKPKTDAMAKRLWDINPELKITSYNLFYDKDTEIEFSFDYVADCIDSVSSKLHLIETAKKLGTPIISACGAGNKLDPTRFEVADIYKTQVCPLARVLRYELKRRGVKDLKVVYSKEEPKKVEITDEGRRAPASSPFCPSVMGIIMANEIVKDLIKGI